ncbi:MAG: KaiC domain-containing protein [Thermoplasmata archaeon]
MKIKTGISGLDNMLEGGIPEHECVAVLGEFGTGKTTLALQFIWEGLVNGEKGIYISLEENSEDIAKNSAVYGWDIDSYIKEDKLLVIKLDPESALNTVERINSDLPEQIREFGAKRLVLDSVSLLSMLFDTDAEKRKGIFSLVKAIKESGATSIITAEVDPRNPSSSRDGLIEYVVDGVILLKYIERADELRLTMCVIKMRRTNHSRKIRPYYITDKGIEVLSGTETY